MTYTIKKYNQLDGVDTYLQHRITSTGEVFMFTGNLNACSWRSEEDLQTLFDLLPYFFDRDMNAGVAHYDYTVVDNEFKEVWME